MSDEKHDITYSGNFTSHKGFLCYKILNLSKNSIVLLKFLEYENDTFIIAVDSLNELFIYNIEREEIVYTYQINYKNEFNNNTIDIARSFNIFIKDSIRLNQEPTDRTFFFFKHDTNIIEFNMTKKNIQDKINFNSNETTIKFKSNDFESERIFIKKVISLDEYLKNSNNSYNSDQYLLSVLYEK
jgi:hypothetical protein